MNCSKVNQLEKLELFIKTKAVYVYLYYIYGYCVFLGAYLFQLFISFKQYMDPREVEHQHIRKDFQYVIVDTDVGGDDAQALITLLHMCKKYNKKLLGITIINGNAVIQDVIKNTLITLAICDEKCPIYAGPDSSICGENHKDYYFGKDGLGMRQAKYQEMMKDKIDTSLVQKKKAYKFIAESASKYREKLGIICLGPLTNIAQAYLYDNQIVNYVNTMSIMGTSDTLAGLHTFYTAEFNIGLDPQASFIVFSKFQHITLVSLDTSIMSVGTQQTMHIFTKGDTKKGAFVEDVFKFQLEKNPPQLPILCDPLAVVFLFRPELIKIGAYINLRVQLKGKRTRGATVVDYFKKGHTYYNAYLVREYNVEQTTKQILQSYCD